MTMMREKEEKVVITFHKTIDAMAFEKSCRAESVGGRLIPLPREIGAECGMAWAAAREEEGRLRILINEKKLKTDKVYHLVL